MTRMDADYSPGEGLGPPLRAEGRTHLWVARQPCAFTLVFLGLVVAASGAFANNFNFSVGFWFVAGPVSLAICGLWYRRRGTVASGVPGVVTNLGGLYVKGGLVLIVATSLIVLLAVDAPVGVALVLLAIGLRLGSRFLVGWAAGFALVGGLARYATFNRLLSQPPHRGPVTPVAFALLGVAMIAGGILAGRREARWAGTPAEPHRTPEHSS